MNSASEMEGLDTFMRVCVSEIGNCVGCGDAVVWNVKGFT